MSFQPAPEVPPWLFMLIGLLGFLMARGGISVDLLCTAADTVRTLAMLGVIVFGCCMLFRSRPAPARPVVSLTATPDPRTVTLSAQQFQALMSMASANAAASAAQIEHKVQEKEATPVAVPEPPATVPPEEIIETESSN